MKRSLWAFLLFLFAVPYMRGQCSSPKSADHGVQLYERSAPTKAASSFWDLFTTLFNPLQPPNKLPFKRSTAFLVGVTEYPRLGSLAGVQNDLRDMCQYLLTNGGFDSVYWASGPAATPDNVNDFMLNIFPRLLSKEDRFLFYFSGHGGDYGGNDPYLLFSGAQKDNIVPSQVILVSQYSVWSGRLPAAHILFIFDTCVAGKVLEPKLSETTQQRISHLVVTLQGKGSREVVTAGTGDQESWYAGERTNSKNGYSVFTRSLLDALQSSSADSVMTIDEAVLRAQKIIDERYPEKPLKPNVQPSYDPRFDGRFVFLNPHAADHSLPEAVRILLSGKGADNVGVPISDINVLKLTGEVGSINDDPSLSLYIAGRALEAAGESSPPENLLTLIDDSLYRGVSFGLFETKDSVKCVAWSPDGKTLASTGSDGTIFLWDAKTAKVRTLGVEKFSISGQGHLAWSPDGRVLAVANDNETIRMLDPETGQILKTIANVGSPMSLAWSPNGKKLAVGSNSRIWIWDPKTGELLKDIKDLRGWVRALAWSADSESLAAAGAFPDILLLNTDTGKVDLTFGGASVYDVNSLAWDPSGSILASGGEHGIQLWIRRTGKIAADLRPQAGTVESVVWSPDGKILASAGDDRTIKLWDPLHGKVEASLEGHVSSDYRGTVHSLSWSSDGRALASAGEDKTIRLWDSHGLLMGRELKSDDWLLSNLSWSPNGEQLALAGSEVQLFNQSTQTFITVFSDNNHPNEQVSWSPNGRILALWSELGDAVRLWDSQTATLAVISKGPDRLIRGVSWSSDSKTLSLAQHDEIEFWDVESHSLSRTEKYEYLGEDVFWSPSGTILCWFANYRRQIVLWDLKTKRILSTLQDPDQFSKAAWSPDGKILATGSADETIKLWNPETGAVIRILEGQHGWVTCLAWSMDGRWLASGSREIYYGIRVWNPETGKVVRRLDNINAAVSSLDWNQQGALGSVAFGKSFTIWPTRSEDLLELIKQSLPLYVPTAKDCSVHLNAASCAPLR